jgi:RNA polymerase sigma factor (sigma-70 family)
MAKLLFPSGDVLADVVVEQAFREYFSTLRVHVYRHCGDWYLADDIVQDTFAVLLKQLRGGKRYDGMSMYSVLVHQAKWTLANHRQASSTRREQLGAHCREQREDAPVQSAQINGENEAICPSAEEVALGELNVGAIMAMLPARLRRPLALRYLADLPPDTVGQAIGRSAGSVSNYLKQGLAILRDAYGVPTSSSVAERRALAREAYRASVQRGTPLTLPQLAKQFGRSTAWANLVIHESGDYQAPDSHRRRVLDALRQQLADGKYAPGEKLPACTVLAGQFGVNDATVCWALRLLSDNGQLQRRDRGNHAGQSHYYVPQPPADAPAQLEATPQNNPVTQVAAALHRQLAQGLYPAGSALPSAKQLAREIEVSAYTTWSALCALAANGALTQRGARYFVPTSAQLTALHPHTQSPAAHAPKTGRAA